MLTQVATERRNVAERVRLEIRRREELKRKKEEFAERARMQVRTPWVILRYCVYVGCTVCCKAQLLPF